MKRLEGKIAIVTGGGQGIGEAIVKRFASEGGKVVVAELNPETGRRSEKWVKDQGGKALFVETDVAQESSVEAMVKATAQKLGKPDIIVNNAGIAVFNDPLKLTDEEWRKCFSVDLDGVWFGCKHVLPHLLDKGGGAIVNIASVHSFQIIPHCFPYPIAKHGVLGLTRALAVEYADRNIRVNSISPGYIFTPINEWFFNTKPDPAKAKKDTEDLHPVKRLGQPDEIAAAAAFMASDEAGFMIGANLVIDGGLTLRIHDN
jgi:NAD(P)-dependent dehydrogenase (short-subunit alcohol dehydrogenase family)